MAYNLFDMPNESVPSILNNTLPMNPTNFALSPTFSAGLFFSELCLLPFGEQTYQDCVRNQDSLEDYASESSKEFSKKFIHGSWQSGKLITNGVISFAIESYQYQENLPTTFPDGSLCSYQSRWVPIAKNSWQNHRNGHFGNGIFTLIMESYGCSGERAYRIFAEKSGFSTEAVQVAQRGITAQEAFVENPSVYGYLAPACHPILGKPDREYLFTSADNQPSFTFCEWNYNGQPVGLYYTTVFDTQLKQSVQKFVRPPAEEILFNKHRILSESTLPIFLYESLEQANELKDHVHSISTWSGELEHVEKTDWSLLRGRQVRFIQCSRQKVVYRLGDQLKAIFAEMGTPLEIGNYGFQ